jgi:hypothetical protein
MPIRPFRDIPKTLVEWGRFFQQAEVTLDDDSIGNGNIEDGAVTFQKIQDVAPDRLLGRDTSPAGVVQELEVGGGLEFTGAGIQRSALTGDVTANAGSNSTTIPDNTISYAKIQDVSTTDRLLGRSTAGAGIIEEIVCTAAGRAILDDADAATQRTTLGLGTMATQSIAGLTAPIVLAAYTVGTVPAAATSTRGLIYVTDESGGAVPAFSDGTNWRRVTDRAVIS